MPVGGVTDPIRLDEGFEILRVDERTPASDPLAFNEDKVREAITIERRDKEREEYMKGLRKDAYLKIAPEYQEKVAPLLKTDTASTGTTTNTTPAVKNSGGKKP